MIQPRTSLSKFAKNWPKVRLKVRPNIGLDLCTCRFLHYPPCEPPNYSGVLKKEAIRVGEHTDFGAFTFLLLGQGAEGLQMKPSEGSEVGGAAGGEEGGWLGVPPPRGAASAPRAEDELVRWARN